MINEETIKKFILVVLILFVVSSVTLGAVFFLSMTGDEEEEPQEPTPEPEETNEVDITVELYDELTQKLITNPATITIYESEDKENSVATLSSPEDTVKNIQKDQSYYIVIQSEYYTNIEKTVEVNKNMTYSINLQPNKINIETTEFESGTITLTNESLNEPIQHTFTAEDDEIVIEDIKSGNYTLKIAPDNADTIEKEINVDGITTIKISN